MNKWKKQVERFNRCSRGKAELKDGSLKLHKSLDFDLDQYFVIT